MVGGILQYIPPAQQVDSGLICTQVDYDIDFGLDGMAETANQAKMTVTYGIPEVDENNQDLGSITIDLGGDCLQLAKGSFTWTSGSKSGEKLGDDDVNPFIIVPQATVKVKNNFKPQVNLAGFMAYYGRINTTPLSFPGIQQTVDAGSARFDGANVQKKFSTEGYQYFEVEYNFCVASHDWNELFDGQQYSTVNPKPYPLAADLNNVWYI